MARIEGLVPFLLKWETGNVIRPSESNEAYYNRCKASRGGISDDPDDTEATPSAASHIPRIAPTAGPRGCQTPHGQT